MFKHAVLFALVKAMKRDGRPLRVVETHAGAGLYDLGGEAARRSKEAEVGVARLMADARAPNVFSPLKQAIRAENAGHVLDVYPGSPLQLATALSKGDAYIGCELRDEDYADLARLLASRTLATRATAQLGNGYEFAEGLPVWGGETLLVIDPPFERGDEYDEIVSAAAAAIQRGYALAIWMPIKDLETFDALISRLEAIRPKHILVAEVRLRPLTDPMKMNGCAMILIDTPDIETEAAQMAAWVATHCGDPGGTARITRA